MYGLASGHSVIAEYFYMERFLNRIFLIGIVPHRKTNGIVDKRLSDELEGSRVRIINRNVHI